MDKDFGAVGERYVELNSPNHECVQADHYLSPRFGRNSREITTSVITSQDKQDTVAWGYV
jgi:hypothetical protein